MKIRSTNSMLTPLDDEYETCERTKAVLRIATGAMHPAEVTSLIKLRPTEVTVVGSQGITNGCGTVHVGRVNQWILDSEGNVTSRDLRRHLDWVIGRVWPSREALLRLQQLPEVKMDVWCVWWSRHGDGGPALWPKQLLGLGELNLEISIGFAFYGKEPTP
jgi:hypothetical protein